MSTLTMFAVCFTALLLLTGTAYTFLEFHRADKRAKTARPAARGGSGARGRGEGGADEKVRR